MTACLEISRCYPPLGIFVQADGGWVRDVGRHGCLSIRYLQGKRSERIGDPFLVVGPLGTLDRYLHQLSISSSITFSDWCETTFTLVAERGAPANCDLQCSGNTGLFCCLAERAGIQGFEAIRGGTIRQRFL